MKITLRQLTVFDCVARHMSFTKAAQEMCLTQPAVSIQIKQLEEMVGLPLFEHIGKKFHLTQAGEELHHTCQDIFSSIDNLEMSLTKMKGGMHGKLRLAVVTSAKYFVPHLLGEFQRQYPGVEMSLVVSNRDQVIRRILNNEDDLVIMAQVPKDLKLRSYPFLDNPMIAIAHPDHPLAGSTDLPLSCLTSDTFLTREAGSGSRMAIEKHLAKQGTRLSKTMELGSSETIKQGVMAGLGLSIVCRHCVTLELATGCLVELDIQGLPIVHNWCLVHHQDKKLSPVAEAFHSFILSNHDKVAQLSDRFNLGDGTGRAR